MQINTKSLIYSNQIDLLGEIQASGDAATGSFLVKPAEACGMRIKTAIRGCWHFQCTAAEFTK
jgi:hypothetical protein